MRRYQLVAFQQPLALSKAFVPVPTGAEVVLRAFGARVCHSDAHLWDGFHGLGDGRKATLETRISLPLTMGHEIAGELFVAVPRVEGVSGPHCPGRVPRLGWRGNMSCSARVMIDEAGRSRR
jgi:D-arabinose 1-dehydrogenase-like Zn-dependent alcohol dehydrogenase